jgi:hypothetical protein
VDRAAKGSQVGVVTRQGAPEGAHAAANQDDSRKYTAVAEAKLRVAAALRLLAHGMASGEIPSTDLSETATCHLAIADDWLATVGARHAV